jgi:hypothetical protein
LDAVSYDIVSIEFPNACVLGSREVMHASSFLFAVRPTTTAGTVR